MRPHIFGPLILALLALAVSACRLGSTARTEPTPTVAIVRTPSGTARGVEVHPQATDERPVPPSRGTAVAATAEPTATAQGSVMAEPTAPERSVPFPPLASAEGLTLVSALRLDPFRQDAHGDVAAYEDVAFVGKRPCENEGVDIVDISDPARPRKITNSGGVPQTTMEDMQAIRIGERDVLAIGLQACDESGRAGTNGLQLVDITERSRPRELGVYRSRHGVHEFDLTRSPTGRTLALLATPGVEAATADRAGAGGEGDLLVVDISIPEKPALLSEWGILDEPALGPEAYAAAARGDFPEVILHSARANADGTRAYLSYWDAGVVFLDIADPLKPRYLGRTGFGPGDEGNAHSVALLEDGEMLVQAEEDFSPISLGLTSNAFTGRRHVFEANYAAPVADLPRGGFAGRIAPVGRGCPAGTRGAPRNGDRYAADPRGKVALIEDGVCPLPQKVARAQEAGAAAVIVYEAARPRPSGPVGEGGSVRLPRGGAVRVRIPAAYVGRADGLALANARGDVRARVSATYNGWGFLRFYDISAPAEPKLLSRFATENTNNPDAAPDGLWSAHNPEPVEDRLFVSWYSDGVRVLDVADPRGPREVASWTGEGAPADAPSVNIWSVVPHGDLLVASDFNYGLYILRAEE